MVLARLRERFATIDRSAEDSDLLDPRVLNRLARIRIRFGRAHGQRGGETPVRGRTQESGIEVESFKSYAPGDDIRYVDWNAVGRLDQLLTRRFVAEREIPVHVLIDASASMGAPAMDGKFRFAVRLATALTWVALNANEPVRLGVLRRAQGTASVEESRLLRHRGRIPTLRPFLEGLEASGETALAEGVRLYLERHRESGVVLVLSDFLVEEEAYRDALSRLRTRGLDVWAVHVVGQHEQSLDGLWGRFRLRDVETGRTREVTVSDSDRRRYRLDFDDRVRRLREFCHRNGIGHVIARPELGVEKNLSGAFATQGMLHVR